MSTNHWPIVGIDPSMSATAVVFEGIYGDPECKLFGSKPTDGSAKARIDRFTELARRVAEEVGHQGHSHVVIESYSHGSRHQAHFLGEYGGLLRYMLLKAGHVVTEVPPTSLKKFVTGSGSGDKTGVIAVLAGKFQVEWKTNDEFDALGCYWYGKVLTGQMQGTSRQMEMLSGKKPKRVRVKA